MRRREFVVLGIAAAISPARAQTSSKRVRLGFLSNYSEPGGQELVGCFKTALAKLGWIEGQNVTFEHRWAAGKPIDTQPSQPNLRRWISTSLQ